MDILQQTLLELGSAEGRGCNGIKARSLQRHRKHREIMLHCKFNCAIVPAAAITNKLEGDDLWVL